MDDILLVAMLILGYLATTFAIPLIQHTFEKKWDDRDECNIEGKKNGYEIAATITIGFLDPWKHKDIHQKYNPHFMEELIDNLKDIKFTCMSLRWGIDRKTTTNLCNLCDHLLELIRDHSWDDKNNAAIDEVSQQLRKQIEKFDK